MRQRDSKVLGGIFRWAQRLKTESVMTHQERRHFQQICAPLPSLITSGTIHRIRRRASADEIIFARACNTGLHHVRDWEQDRSHPRGPELKLIHLARKRGVDVVSRGADR